MHRVEPGDRAEFRALVDELADLGGGDAARAEQVERRLIQLVTTEIPQDERRRHVRLPCDLRVTMRAGGETAAGVVVDVGTGGIFVESALPAKTGDAIEVEIQGEGDPLHVKGKVAWAATTRRTGQPGLGIAFVAGDDEGSDHRLRMVILSLLRKRLAATEASR